MKISYETVTKIRQFFKTWPGIILYGLGAIALLALALYAKAMFWRYVIHG